MTFDRLSHIVQLLAGRVAELVVHLFNLEMDSVAASKKLQELGIEEVLIQAEIDPLMDRCRLGDALRREHLDENKIFYTDGAHHNDFPIRAINREIRHWDRQTEAPVAV